MEAEQPERVVTTESEGGFHLHNPPPVATQLGCETEWIEIGGRVSRATREILDSAGKVVLRPESTDDYGTGLGSPDIETRTYDERGRVLEAKPLYQTRVAYAYEGQDMLVQQLDATYFSPAMLFRLDDAGRVVEHVSSTSGYVVTWVDDTRPRDFTTATFTRHFSWDSEGFLVEATTTRASKSCARRFFWEKRDLGVSLEVRDEKDRTAWRGSYGFDADGRMTLATYGGWKVAWVHRDGWASQTDVDGHTFRTSVACHYPPTRNELATALAAAMWSPPDELRPDRLHPLPYLQIPTTECSP